MSTDSKPIRCSPILFHRRSILQKDITPFCKIALYVLSLISLRTKAKFRHATHHHRATYILLTSSDQGRLRLFNSAATFSIFRMPEDGSSAIFTASSLLRATSALSVKTGCSGYFEALSADHNHRIQHHMSRGGPLPLSLILLMLIAVSSIAQSPANSNIQSDATDSSSFNESLRRDLTAYFCKTYKKCRVDFEFLQNVPTPTGVSYPKYFLWAKAFSANKLISEGAVRVAAIDQQHFDVINFLDADEITASPADVEQIFPAALVQKIIAKAAH